jgi:hypothetical protein
MASEVLSSLAIPPAESSMSRFWSLHTARLRWLPMSTLRFASNRRIAV